MSGDLPIGTPVLAYPGLRPEDDPDCRVLDTVTRSEPWTLCGSRVVLVEGHAGGIALTHIERKDQTSDAPVRNVLNSLEDVRGYVAITLDHANGKTWTWENDEVVGMLLDIINGLTAEVEARAATDRVSIPRPRVLFGPKGMTPDEATAMYLRGIVDRHLPVAGSSSVGGSNVTATVRQLLSDVADALTPAGGEE